MATTTTTPATTARFRPWRMTVADYLRMIETGILTERDRVFLWKGRVLVKMTKGRPHTLTELRVAAALARVIPESHYIEQQQPVAFVNRRDSLPEPDLMVVRGRPKDYADTPTTRDVALIIEVSDSTVRFDLGTKQRGYASESVENYWVVSVSGRWVEAFSRPSGPTSPTGYQQRTTYRPGDRVPVRLDSVEVGHVSVDEILP